ncbi:MAG: TlpA disulfide reductase family protein [Acidobacteriota bacterium]|jgi:thiol-disulfide isomerase/thioredoxin
MGRVFVVLGVLLTTFLGPCLVAGAEDEVPVFPNLAFTALDGSRQLDLESFRGRPVLMTFWASWCGPCREELPELQKLAVELADAGFALITINIDQHPVQGARFLQKYDIDVPVYRMDQGTLQRLGLTSVPTNLLLDREGRPVQIYRGYSPQVPSEIRKLVRGMDDSAAGSDGQ